MCFYLLCGSLSWMLSLGNTTNCSLPQKKQKQKIMADNSFGKLIWLFPLNFLLRHCHCWSSASVWDLTNLQYFYPYAWQRCNTPHLSWSWTRMITTLTPPKGLTSHFLNIACMYKMDKATVRSPIGQWGLILKPEAKHFSCVPLGA